MTRYLCFTIRFLQPYSHGRDDNGEPEWPPSPLRLYQALVAASAARWNERMRLGYAVPALSWLETLPPPMIISCPIINDTRGYRLYVPNNLGDRVARSWALGNPSSIADYRTEKDVRAKQLSGEVVRFVFTLKEDDTEIEKHFPVLRSAAESITHLGWGIDMVVGHAQLVAANELDHFEGERWLPSISSQSGVKLRVPIAGTLVDLMNKHHDFLNRVAGEDFRPVPPLTTFNYLAYQSSQESKGNPFVTFDILKPSGESYRIFNTQRSFHRVSGLVRHATAEICQNWPYGSIASFIHGHDENNNSQPIKGIQADHRFMFLPLPTIEMRPNHPHTVTEIRRVMITALPEFQNRVDWLRRRLSGCPLISEHGEEIAELSYTPPKNPVIQKYVKSSQVWSSVIPVTLPGYDDRNSAKTEKLLRKCLMQAGLPKDLTETAELEWRAVGFWAGLALPNQYIYPSEIKGPRYHVRIRFQRPISGPLAIGAGRYRGCGLLAAQD